MTLTDSQARNLSHLAEVGTFTFTDSIRLEAPRRNNRLEMSNGYRQVSKSKGDHKGFHMTALYGLVELGLVTCKTIDSGDLQVNNYGHPMNRLENIGKHRTVQHIFTIA